MWQQKLGLAEWTPAARAVQQDLLALMERSAADYTLTFRQLAVLAESRRPPCSRRKK